MHEFVITYVTTKYFRQTLAQTGEESLDMFCEEKGIRLDQTHVDLHRFS
jgi:hypothetical protein